MIYITQLIYIHEHQEKTLDEFEAHAIPIIQKHNGLLLFRLRPEQGSIIEANEEVPFEIHVVTFPNESDFNRFMMDEERRRYLHLKERAIRKVTLIKGSTA